MKRTGTIFLRHFYKVLQGKGARLEPRDECTELSSAPRTCKLQFVSESRWTCSHKLVHFHSWTSTRGNSLFETSTHVWCPMDAKINTKATPWIQTHMEKNWPLDLQSFKSWPINVPSNWIENRVFINHNELLRQIKSCGPNEQVIDFSIKQEMYQTTRFYVMKNRNE